MPSFYVTLSDRFTVQTVTQIVFFLVLAYGVRVNWNLTMNYANIAIFVRSTTPPPIILTSKQAVSVSRPQSTIDS